MDTRIQSQTAGLLTLVVGAWLLFSPLFITMTGAALISTMVVGGLLALAGLVELFWQNAIPSWLSAVAAVWLFVSIFVFTMSDAAAWNLAIASVAAFVLSVWDGLEIAELNNQGQQLIRR